MAGEKPKEEPKLVNITMVVSYDNGSTLTILMPEPKELYFDLQPKNKKAAFKVELGSRGITGVDAPLNQS